MPSADIVIIGSGPSGLAVGACLAQRGLRPHILERGETVASSWARHYESLRLHTTREMSSLPGFPLSGDRYPNRSEFYSYLKTYAQQAGLKIDCGREVTALVRENGRWRVETSRGPIHAPHVVIASGWHTEPRHPSLNGQEKFRGRWLRPVEIRSGAEWTGRRVLIVGLGNTAADIIEQLHGCGALTAVCVRGPLWITPLEIFGANAFRWKRWIPEQMFSLRRLGNTAGDIAEWIAGRFWSWIQKRHFADLRDHGLSFKSPEEIIRDDKSFRVPIVAGAWVDLVRRGEVPVFPDIAEFTAEGAVFVDGRRESFTDVVLATGFLPKRFPLAGELPWPPNDGAIPNQPGLWLIGARPALRRIGPAARRVARAIAREMRRSRAA